MLAGTTKSVGRIAIALCAATTLARAEEPPQGAAGEPAADVITEPVRVEDVPVLADDEEEAAASDAARALDEPAFVTVVRIDRRRGELPSVAEALAESVGATVRALGGLGAFASISMRGAPAGQTEILIDGVPLSRVAFSSVDVGSLDLATFDRVDVYRGGVPVALGGAGLGGAVNFLTRVGPDADGRRNHVTAGGGSFGARRALVTRGDAALAGRLRTRVGVGYSGATGDFPYFDDNGTPLNDADDSYRPRSNNGYDQLDATARAEWDGDVRVAAGERVSLKAQGVPGPTGVSARRASLDTIRSVTDVRAERTSLFDRPELSGGGRGYLVVERQRYRDPEGEVGLAVQDLGYTTVAGAIALHGAWTPSLHQRWTTALDARVERFTQREHAMDAPAQEQTLAAGTRLGVAFSVADDVVLGGDEQVVVIPALRAELLRTRGDGAMTVSATVPTDRTDVELSPRLGARWRVAPTVTLKANAGRYFRSPTVVELFGDRGFVVGNGGLRPERGETADVGVVVAPPRAGALDRLYAEVAAFGTRARDLITFLPTSGRTSRAANVEDAWLGGIELAVAARAWRWLSLTGNYTLLATRQESPMVSVDGKALPGRPRHEAFVRVDAARRVGEVEVGGYGDLTYVSGNFLDIGNVSQVPERRFVGAGVRAALGGLTLAVEGKNLLDAQVEHVRAGGRDVPRAVADVLDYPLPGRSLHASLDWSF